MRRMTEKLLNEAFAGESMAHMKYLIFSEVAEREGFSNVSRLFKAIAYAEQVHATNHARNLSLVKGTKDNLQAGVDGETFEVEEMYPAYDAVVKLQNEKNAETSIRYALEAEKIHAGLYQEAKQSVESGKDLDIGDIYICPVCGYTHVGTPPDRCPVCNASKDKFKKF
ncbi:MAG TPA: rubrerythrin family protein [Thermoplasmatales archaeon]|nr:rubrerythrin family protein [Thermoplasmatales archaeon]